MKHQTNKEKICICNFGEEAPKGEHCQECPVGLQKKVQTNKEILKDFDICQTKIWQLPNKTSFEMQTILFIREWVEKALHQTAISTLEDVKREVGRLKYPSGISNKEPDKRLDIYCEGCNQTLQRITQRIDEMISSKK